MPSTAPREATKVLAYSEPLRPQFHFTSERGWLNDPNGLVYFKGEYHLFFQHNPSGTDWGNMTWGHAASPDLLHWRQLPDAIHPDALGTIFSGSAAVDRARSGASAKTAQPSLFALYTAAGGTSDESKGQPFTQCLATSDDRGRTWKKFAGNPVVPHIVGENRDPKVVWHAPSQRWIMALYLHEHEFGLLASADLMKWNLVQRLVMEGCDECPDFFEIPVQNQQGIKKWVLTAANGSFLAGEFDGTTFTPLGAPRRTDFGPNYYAVQTWSDIPTSDGRRIQIAWMRGGSYPGMPFNQQMSFPVELQLFHTAEGYRLHRWPVREIKNLWVRESRATRTTLHASETHESQLSGDLHDIEMALDLGVGTVVTIQAGPTQIALDAGKGTVACGGAEAPLYAPGGTARVRLLIDRTSCEVFTGEASFSTCVPPLPPDSSLAIRCTGGTVNLRGLQLRRLRSAWQQAPAHSRLEA